MPHTRSIRSCPALKTSRHAISLALCLCLAACLLSACSAPKKRKQIEQVHVAPRTIPEPLRGTIGSMAQSTAGEPILISGFGLVVGLNGTGGGLLDERISSTLERQMALQGIGTVTTDSDGTSLIDPVLRRPKTPAEILRDKHVAVVLVQAVVPRGAPEHYTFDVYVQAMNATSLEGGRLWTTDLRLGPPGVFGGVQTKRFAQARGDIFINPFEDPAAASGADARTVGRVLAGGVVTDPMGIRLTLDVPSHSRARTIVHAINSRFPMGINDIVSTAVGHDDSIILLHIPWAYQSRPNEFIRIVEHLPIDLTYPQELSLRYIDAMHRYPELLDDMTWCLVAVGDQAVPFLRDVYGDPNPEIRLAALRAGAMLGDVRAGPPLIDLATAGSAREQTDAISLLGELDGSPRIDIVLRDLISSDSLTIRTAAYEALAKRAQRHEYARLLSIEANRPSQSGMARTPAELALIAKLRIPPSSMQGIVRVTVPGKFVLDVVPYGKPLVYVSQQGTPRIVLFGKNLQLRRPMLASAWDDRLMIIADSPAEQPRLRYEDYRTGRVTIHEVSPNLPDLILSMAKDPEPEDDTPGLGMTYSEVVGALFALYKSGSTTAAFATETDRLMAELVEAARAGRVLERPETLADKKHQPAPEEGVVVDASYLKAERDSKPRVVPLAPREPKKKK